MNAKLSRGGALTLCSLASCVLSSACATSPAEEKNVPTSKKPECSAPTSLENRRTVSAYEPRNWNNGSDHYDNLASLKKGMPWASKWWNVDIHGTPFAVCLEVPLYYGQSTENVYAWRKNPDDSFTCVWCYRSYGIGPIEVEIDEDNGTVSVRAIAYTEYEGSIVAFAHLGATARY